MTINEAITAADGLRNNSIPEAIKIRWLSELDGRIYTEIIKPYQKDETSTVPKYDESTPADTELIVPHPYDGLYLAYLEMEIARQNAELPRYNNAAIVFNEKFSAFKRWYNRNNTKLSAFIKFPTRWL